VNGAIRYKVTVVALVERVERAGKNWERTTAEPTAAYAYTPEIEKTVQREVAVFEQHTERLNMRALVAVLNDLPVPLGETPEHAR
jgi:hypothetical protein